MDTPSSDKRSFPIWGTEIDDQAIQQMERAMRLPVTVAGALMPDAHVGYGLPIGGVLATDGVVIPYCVGVDIACRMMMTVFDAPGKLLTGTLKPYRRALETHTQFGVGAEWARVREHPVMDGDWNVSAITRQIKERAHRQLGTSGSGNHFVEFGILTVEAEEADLAPGDYVALLSHSGSRNAGARVCEYYSKAAQSLHPELPDTLRHLAWLPLSGDGAEYWAAMELMGAYASANHHLIHDAIVDALGHPVLKQVENHHNFAWKETHHGRAVVVHRKGATPAGKGQLGVIPGSMATPGYLVVGLGNDASLHSAAHGAGRKMSRKEAHRRFSWDETRSLLSRAHVEVLSAGLDEVPWAYKNIERVMAAQHDLARPIAVFHPRLVKMAPSGEQPED